MRGQLNFNQGQLCLLNPAEGAARGEKARGEQQEERRPKDHTVKAHNVAFLWNRDLWFWPGECQRNQFQHIFMTTIVFLNVWKVIFWSEYLLSCSMTQLPVQQNDAVFSVLVNLVFYLQLLHILQQWCNWKNTHTFTSFSFSNIVCIYIYT